MDKEESLYHNSTQFNSLHHQMVFGEILFHNKPYVFNTINFDPKLINLFSAWRYEESKFYSRNELQKIMHYHFKHSMTNFLSFISIDINELRKKEFSEIVSAIEDYPIIKFSNGYFITSKNLVNQAFYRNLNYVLKDNQDYKKDRGEFCEDFCIKIFESYLENAIIHKNVKYGKYEVDILIEYDSKLYIIECKAIDVYMTYKRNITVNKSNLDDIITKSYNQAIRAKEAVLNKKITCLNSTYSSDDIYMMSISTEHPYNWEKHLPNIANFLNFSLSDIWAIAQCIAQGLYKINEYNNIMEVINDFYELKPTIDNLRNYILINYLGKETVKEMEIYNTDHNVYLDAYRVMDNTIYSFMLLGFDAYGKFPGYVKLEDVYNSVKKTDELTSYYLSKEVFYRRWCITNKE